MKYFVLLLLLIALFSLVSAENIQSNEDADILDVLEKDLERDQEEDDQEADEESVSTHPRDVSVPVVMVTHPPPAPLGSPSISVIVGYAIAGSVGVILLIAVIIGAIAGFATISQSPIKYNDLLILNSNKSQVHETFLDHMELDRDSIVVGPDQKHE
jgi:hypothetical protein